MDTEVANFPRLAQLTGGKCVVGKILFWSILYCVVSLCLYHFSSWSSACICVLNFDLSVNYRDITLPWVGHGHESFLRKPSSQTFFRHLHITIVKKNKGGSTRKTATSPFAAGLIYKAELVVLWELLKCSSSFLKGFLRVFFLFVYFRQSIIRP